MLVKRIVSLLVCGAIVSSQTRAEESDVDQLKELIAHYSHEESLSTRKDAVEFYISAIKQQLDKCKTCDDNVRYLAFKSLIELYESRSDYETAIALSKQQLGLHISTYKKFEAASRLANLTALRTYSGGTLIENSRLVVLACQQAEQLYSRAKAEPPPVEIRTINGQKVAVTQDLANLTMDASKIFIMHSDWAATAGDYADAFRIDQLLITLLNSQANPKNLDGAYSNTVDHAIASHARDTSVQLLGLLMTANVSKPARIVLTKRMARYMADDPGTLHLVESEKIFTEPNSSYMYEFWQSVAERLYDRGDYEQCILRLDQQLQMMGANSKSIVLEPKDPQVSKKISLYKLLAAAYSRSDKIVLAKAINDYINSFQTKAKTSITPQ